MINSSISKWDHKCETWKVDLEIGTDRSSQTLQNPQADGYGFAFGPTRVSRSGFWIALEPNQPIFAVQTRSAGRFPGPIADTIQFACSLDPRLSLNSVDYWLETLLCTLSGTYLKGIFEVTQRYPSFKCMFKLTRLEPACTPQCSLNRDTQAVITLYLSSVCSQNNHMYTHGDIQADNTCHIKM